MYAMSEHHRKTSATTTMKAMRKLVRRSALVAGMCGAGAVVLSGYQAATTPFRDWPAFQTPREKLITHYSYFTLWSNIIAVGVCAQYAAGRRHPALAFLRIDAVTMMIVTGAVYNALLAKTTVVEGLGNFTNPIVHTAMPIAMPALWVMDRIADNSGEQDIRTDSVAAAFGIPLVWAVYAFTRGVTTKGYYPYDFMNAVNMGYPAAIRNVAAVGGVMGVLIAGMAAIERATQAN